jgi:hypothetical protein
VSQKKAKEERKKEKESSKLKPQNPNALTRAVAKHIDFRISPDQNMIIDSFAGVTPSTIRQVLLKTLEKMKGLRRIQSIFLESWDKGEFSDDLLGFLMVIGFDVLFKDFITNAQRDFFQEKVKKSAGLTDAQGKPIQPKFDEQEFKNYCIMQLEKLEMEYRKNMAEENKVQSNDSEITPGKVPQKKEGEE